MIESEKATSDHLDQSDVNLLRAIGAELHIMQDNVTRLTEERAAVFVAYALKDGDQLNGAQITRAPVVPTPDPPAEDSASGDNAQAD